MALVHLTSSVLCSHKGTGWNYPSHMHVCVRMCENVFCTHRTTELSDLCKDIKGTSRKKHNAERWVSLMNCGHWTLVKGLVCSVWGGNSGCKNLRWIFPFHRSFEEEQRTEPVMEIILLSHGWPRPPRMAADCTELSYQWQHLHHSGLQTEETSTLRLFTQHPCPRAGSTSDYPCSSYHVTRGNFRARQP